MKLEIATPDQSLPMIEVQEVTVPTVAGEAMILPGHARMVSELAEGKLSYRGADSKSFSVQGGVVEVKEDRVVVLCDQAGLS